MTPTAMYDRNKTFWWSPQQPRRIIGKRILENAGDALGPALIDRILRANGQDIHRMLKPRLLSIGSVMHFAHDQDTIWGTGINGKISLEHLKFKNLDVRAVRGPLTRQILEDRGITTPEIYGDPGILTSIFWEKSPPSGNSVFIPHMREDVPWRTRLRHKVLSPLTPLDEFISIISGAKEVYSSSLHGIVIAESFGIPSKLIRNKSGEAPFKYQDYYEGTGRKDFRIFESIEEARSHSASAPDLEKCAKRLLAAFPYDLWEGPTAMKKSG